MRPPGPLLIVRRSCLLCGRPVRLARLGDALAVLEGHDPAALRPHRCVDPIDLERARACRALARATAGRAARDQAQAPATPEGGLDAPDP